MRLERTPRALHTGRRWIAQLATGVMAAGMILGLPVTAHAHAAPEESAPAAAHVAEAVQAAPAAPGARSAAQNTETVFPDYMRIELSSTQVPADGFSQVTVTVFRDFQSYIPGAQIEVVSDDPEQLVSALTDHGDGRYTATVTATTEERTSRITARVLNASPDWELFLELTQLPAPSAEVTVTAGADTLFADGVDSVPLLVTVNGEAGPRSGETVELSSSDPEQRISAVTDEGDGNYSAVLTAGTTLGVAEVTARVPSVPRQPSATTTVTQLAGPPAAVSAVLSDAAIVADGTATTTATVRVADAQGRPLTGESVSVTSTDAEQGIGAVTDHGDGSYSAVITASEQLGDSTIVASAGEPGATVTGEATLTQIAGAPDRDRTTVRIAPAQLVADGKSETEVTVEVRDAQGRALEDTELSLESTDAGQRLGAFEEVEPGVYAATVRSSTVVGESTLTVRTPVAPVQPPVVPDDSSSAGSMFGAAQLAPAGSLGIGEESPAADAGVLGRATLTQLAPKSDDSGRGTEEPERENGGPVARPAVTPPAPQRAAALAATGSDSGVPAGWALALLLAGASALVLRPRRR